MNNDASNEGGHMAGAYSDVIEASDRFETLLDRASEILKQFRFARELSDEIENLQSLIRNIESAVRNADRGDMDADALNEELQIEGEALQMGLDELVDFELLLPDDLEISHQELYQDLDGVLHRALDPVLEQGSHYYDVLMRSV